MDKYPEILEMVIPSWKGKDKGLHKRCSEAWSSFMYLGALLNAGCELNVKAWEAHAAELDATGKKERKKDGYNTR